MLLRTSALLVLLGLSLGCPKAASETTTASGPSGSSGSSEPPSPNTTTEVAKPETAEPSSPPAPELAPGQELLESDRERSSVGFAVARATIGHIGHFARFDASLTLQAGKPVGLAITVRTGSVAADQHGLTEHLKSADFFDVDKFPVATFTAESIEPLADDDAEGSHRVRGTMLLHGVEAKLDFPATLSVGADQVVGSAVLDISAKAFGIDYEGMAAELAEDLVHLEIELVFPRVAADR